MSEFWTNTLQLFVLFLFCFVLFINIFNSVKKYVTVKKQNNKTVVFEFENLNFQVKYKKLHNESYVLNVVGLWYDEWYIYHIASWIRIHIRYNVT